MPSNDRPMLTPCPFGASAASQASGVSRLGGDGRTWPMPAALPAVMASWTVTART